MSIYNLELDTLIQNFNVSQENKEIYGDVQTDIKLIHTILNLIPKKFFLNPNLKWLDPCAGKGYFSMVLYKKLFKGLESTYINPQKRHSHIITNMLYINEINSSYIPVLKMMFGEKSNVFNQNFLKHNQKYDFIIGNPPYNCNGLIKVPTSRTDKKKDGKSIWQSFILKSLSLLKNNGYLNFITPSIWMKNDHPLFNTITSLNICSIHTLNNTETNKLFRGQAQTPTSYFLIQNKKGNHIIPLFSKIHNKYIHYHINKCYIDKPLSLPLLLVSIIQKLQRNIEKDKYIQVIKTNMRPGYKNLKISSEKSKSYPFPNISTCKLQNTKPKLIINYSNIECVYKDKPKLVLAHKMYGFPFYDKKGIYGISNRDNYVILNKNNKDFLKLKQFLSTKFILTLFEATRYRMKYLEKYIFELIPDITYIHNFPNIISDETIFLYFQLDELERNFIKNFHKKNYTFF